MKKTISRLHKSQQLRDIKKKSMIFSPEGRSDVIEFLIHHITQLPKCAIYAAIGIIGIAAVDNTSALSYSDDVGVNFTFDQSLTVSLSSADIMINNLAPGSSSDSNIITVKVLSNNASGYELKSSVGNNTTYDTRDLTYSSDSSDAVFSSIDYGSSLESLTGDNTWGYSYSTDNNSWSNYSGLPKYNDTTNVATLRTNSGPSASTGDNTYFKIAAKASTTQPSGEYRNVINFTVTAEHNPVSFYDAFKEAATKDPTITTLNGYYKMQDMSPAICNAVELYDDDSHIQLIDTRDHEVYYIGKLKDNRCWLLDNLRLGSSDYEIPLTPEDTNIAEAYILPVGISGWSHMYTAPRINADFKNALTTSYGTASGKMGVYYNYCAVSAGTYCYEENSGTGNAYHDICPIGWHMPNNSGYRTIYVDHYTNADATSLGSVQHSLSTPLSGRATEYQGVEGFFWSSTYGFNRSMYRFGVTSTSQSLTTNTRGASNSLRCITNN